MPTARTSFLLSSEPLDESVAGLFLRSTNSGAEVLFQGVARRNTSDRTVLHLVFEAYEPMVLKEWDAMTEKAFSQWDLHRILVHHRTGWVMPGEVAVMVAVAARHRAPAFEACTWLMDELKRTVPIWKKEVFSDGSQWVNPHP
ncbi:MAG: molybdenum cofactor biosynthesis protein MoaE [Flavobacteriales bacterium]|jgi:molybdopterin synthase catalytic subunit